MKVLIVPAVAVRDKAEFVYPGEIQVVGYREHVEEICHLDELLECARGDLKQALKISAYDEAKERELFEAYASTQYRLQELPLEFDDGEYIEPETQYSWEAWQACAKSRAGIQS